MTNFPYGYRWHEFPFAEAANGYLVEVVEAATGLTLRIACSRDTSPEQRREIARGAAAARAKEQGK